MVKTVFPTPTIVPQGIGSPLIQKALHQRETKALIIEMANLQTTFNQKGVILGMVIG